MYSSSASGSAPMSALGAPSVSSALLPPSLPPLSAPSALGGGAFLPLPPVVGVGATAPRVAMEGKSLFTCHGCGALLKFKYSPVSIEDKIRRLRPIEFERKPLGDLPSPAGDGSRSSTDDALEADAEAGESDSEGGASGRGSMAIALALAGGRKSATADGGAAPPLLPMVVPEVVWESQSAQESDDSAAVWVPARFAPAQGESAFYSCNRGLHGDAVADVVPARLLTKPHLWLSPGWDVDMTLPQCDNEGWIYAASFADFHTPTLPRQSEGEPVDTAGEKAEGAPQDADIAPQECVVRRRRLIRKRQIDGSDLSWFQELLDCRCGVGCSFTEIALERPSSPDNWRRCGSPARCCSKRRLRRATTARPRYSAACNSTGLLTRGSWLMCMT